MRSIFVFAALIGVCRCRNRFNAQHPILASAKSPIDQPLLGFGTWNLRESGDNTSDAVAIAMEAGYRQIDCATAYGNEKYVGKGIAKGLEKTGLNREDIWVTSKLWNDHHGEYARVEEGLNKTLKDLNLEYLDLYLMHWPVGKGPDQEKYHYDYVETWKSMAKLLSTHRVRHIGISNFSPSQLHHLLSQTMQKPSAHQMELHPYLPQTDWIRFHQAHGISITAYSPLGNMNPTYGDRARRSPATRSNTPLLLENETVGKIAEARGCTPAQVVLAWGMGRATSVIPKSKHESHIRENFGSLKCVLEVEDWEDLETLGEEPTRFNNPSKAWGVDLFEGLDDA
ncbi:Aldo/keto reductase [Corynespora cassiicola Philippines]|uniref:Aldo/keto reductase n=1 Tax=Corynespora cassiicola Philippines TaxID=1448308 RepID=A0A2T2NY09_CORCC|nr:Aldo/keto reductase [Corynespora cassiicola Philippines]